TCVTGGESCSLRVLFSQLLPWQLSRAWGPFCFRKSYRLSAFGIATWAVTPLTSLGVIPHRLLTSFIALTGTASVNWTYRKVAAISYSMAAMAAASQHPA